MKLTKNNEIVICKSDKDGKILIVDFCDYISVMNTQFANYNKLQFIDDDEYNTHIRNIVKQCEKSLVVLHQEGVCNDKLLYQIARIKIKDGKYTHVIGSIAKYFCCNTPAYAYPLFKTHKLSEDQLQCASIFDIPVRLLQSAGHIPTSRITAFLELILQPVSKTFCQMEINEYCRDSQHYLSELVAWKNEVYNNIKDTLSSDPLFIVAADVAGLYPNLKRDLISQALHFALDKYTQFSSVVSGIIVKLAKHTLENVSLKHQDQFYRQSQGLVTGDNHSVSLANITMHFIIQFIASDLKKTILFKRFIDDIIFLSIGNNQTIMIKQCLKATFSKYGLELSFCEASTDSLESEVEFLDVNHVIGNTNPFGFITRNYVKPTAVHRRFLHGSSHHPPSVFKYILIGKAKRLRRLNEYYNDFTLILQELKDKALKSNFPLQTVEKVVDLALQWKDQIKDNEGNNGDSDDIKKRVPITWPTAFPNLLRLNEKQRKLGPTSMISYERPPNLFNLLTNYKKLSHGDHDNQSHFSPGSFPCRHSALCGSFGKNKESMVSPTHILQTPNNSFHLTQHLTCRHCGIYVATCCICKEQYV